MKKTMLKTLIPAIILLLGLVPQSNALQEFGLVNPNNTMFDVDVWEKFAWQNAAESTETVYYNLQIGTSPLFTEGSYMSFDSLTNSEFRPSVDLIMATSYVWRILAYTETGDSLWSSGLMPSTTYMPFETLDDTLPRLINASELESEGFDRTIITENTPYIVRGDNLVIPKGIRLSVQEGIMVMMEGDYAIQVHGRLEMLGTETDSITLTTVDSLRTPGAWGHIEIYDEADTAYFDSEWNYLEGTGSVFKYVNFLYAGDGQRLIYSPSTGIYVTNCFFWGDSCTNPGGIQVKYNSCLNSNYISGFGNSEDGGGIHVVGRNVNISDNTIINCHSYYSGNGDGYCRGGGIYAIGTDLYIDSNSISDCYVYRRCGDYYSGYAYAYGGGLYLDVDSSTIVNNVVTGCYCQAVRQYSSVTYWSRGGGGYLESGIDNIFSGNTFSNNTARTGGIAYGGGLYVNCPNTRIDRSTITNNHSDYEGGGMANGHIISNSTIKYNTVADSLYGGGGYYGNPDSINFCNINHNSGYQLKMNGTEFTDATNNWWFTRSYEGVIATYIYDRVDTTLGALGEAKWDPPLFDVSDSTPGIFTDAYSLRFMDDSTYTTELTSCITVPDTVYIEMTGFDANPYSKDVAVINVYNPFNGWWVNPFYEETDDSTGVWHGKFYIDVSTDLSEDRIEAAINDTLLVAVLRDTAVNLLLPICAAIEPNIIDFSINNDNPATGDSVVLLTNTCENNPLEYMASEDSEFGDATWQTYSTEPEFILSSGFGFKRVYFKTRNATGESGVVSDEIEYTEGPCNFSIANAEVQLGVSSAVPITARELNGVAGMQLYIGYQSSMIRIDSLAYNNSYFDSPTDTIMTDSFSIVWEDFENPFTVADGDTLIKIWVTPIGSVGDSSVLSWIGENEIVDIYGDPILGLTYCDGSTLTSAFISGTFYYYNLSERIPDVVVSLSGHASREDTTETDGTYIFNRLTPGDYTSDAFKDEGNTAASVADVIKMRRHLAWLEPFDSPFKLLAGDINKDCRISVADIIKLRRWLAFLDTIQTWHFIDSTYVMNESSWCYAPEFLDITISTQSVSDAAFIGYHMGDVNDTWTSGGFSQTKLACAGTGILKVADSYNSTDGNIVVPVVLSNIKDLTGIEIHLSFDNSKLEYTGLNSSLLSDMTTNADDNNIHIVWEQFDNPLTTINETTIIELYFKSRDTDFYSTPITVTKSEVVNQLGHPYILDITNGELVSRFSAELPSNFELKQNRPNPFNPVTSINFSLPKATEVELTVYNIAGQRVQVLADGYFNAGMHTLEWDAGNIASGIYFYRIKAGEFVDSKKMILLK